VTIDHVLDTGVANLVARDDPVALDEPASLRRLASASLVLVPEIVFGELYCGAYAYAHRHSSTKLLIRYDTFRQRYCTRLLQYALDTAQIYGAIAAELRVRGQPIPTNDVWIAALARQYGLTLATLDSDFTRVSGLTVEIW
jgi:tRNA(fMet)-specific endonuclease VapC